MERGRQRGAIHRGGSRLRLADIPRPSDRLVIPHPVEPASGKAKLIRFRNPFELFYVASVEIKRSRRGRGLGSSLVEAVNNFLKNARTPGLLLDAIESHSPAANMYERYGWTPVTGHEDWHYFNVPSRIKLPQIHRAIEQIDETLSSR